VLGTGRSLGRVCRHLEGTDEEGVCLKVSRANGARKGRPDMVMVVWEVVEEDSCSRRRL